MALEVRLGNRARSAGSISRFAAQPKMATRFASCSSVAFLPTRMVTTSTSWWVCLNRWHPMKPGAPAGASPSTLASAKTTYAHLRLDVVARAEEIATRCSLESSTSLALPRHNMRSSIQSSILPEDVEYPDALVGEPETLRVRDLPDLVLLIEDGVTATPSLLAIVSHVFERLEHHPVPSRIELAGSARVVA